MVRPLIMIVLFAPAFPQVARADSGVLLDREKVWTAWNFDLLILLNLAALSYLYWLGATRLWKRAGVGNGLSYGSLASFVIAIVVLFVALISPLDTLSEQLSSAHMLQHMLLVVVAAPLFVAAMPGRVFLWGVPLGLRSIVTGWVRCFDVSYLNRPLFPGLLFAVTLWMWHLPAAYQTALVDPFVHDAQHLTFFGAACLFWRVVISPRGRWQIHPLSVVIYLFATSLHATLLGVFMSLAPSVWYDVYAATTPRWGFTPMEDQQLAGLIMWMPACLVFPASAAFLFGNWLSSLTPERHLPVASRMRGV